MPVFFIVLFFTHTASQCSDTDGEITSCLGATVCHMHRCCFFTWSCDQTALNRLVSSSSAVGPRSKTLRRAEVDHFRLPYLDARLITQTRRWPSANSHGRIHFREASESVATGFLLLFRAAKPIRAKRLCNRWANVGMSQQKPELKSLQCCELGVGKKMNEHIQSIRNSATHTTSPQVKTQILPLFCECPKEKIKQRQLHSIIHLCSSPNWSGCASCWQRLPQPFAMRGDSTGVKCHELLWVSQAGSGLRCVHSPAPRRHTNQNSSLPCAPAPSRRRRTHYLWMGVALPRAFPPVPLHFWNATGWSMEAGGTQMALKARSGAQAAQRKSECLGN